MVNIFLFYNFSMKKILVLVLSIFITSAALGHENENIVLNATVAKSSISSDTAVYNVSNAKMHTHDCEWAQKCTKNCVYLHKDEIQDMFYIPCAACGGGVIESVEKTSDEE